MNKQTARRMGEEAGINWLTVMDSGWRCRSDGKARIAAAFDSGAWLLALGAF